MTAKPEHVGAKARAYCDTCDVGIKGVGWTKAVVWADSHNATAHGVHDVRPAPPEVPAGVDMSHAPGNARPVGVAVPPEQ